MTLLRATAGKEVTPTDGNSMIMIVHNVSTTDN